MAEQPASAEARFVKRALAFRAWLRDPALPGLVLMGALVLFGFAAIAFAWFGSAKIIYVPLQIPRAVSGGLGGLALIGVGVALFDIQSHRRDEARERKLTDDVVDEVAELIGQAPQLERIARRNRTS